MRHKLNLNIRSLSFITWLSVVFFISGNSNKVDFKQPISYDSQASEKAELKMLPSDPDLPLIQHLNVTLSIIGRILDKLALQSTENNIKD